MKIIILFLFPLLLFDQMHIENKKNNMQWRSVWSIYLEAEYKDGKLPCVLKVHFKNNSQKNLVGSNLLFDIYTEGSVLCWAYQDSIRNKDIKLYPNEEIEIKIPFNKLTFLDLHGKIMKTEKAVEILSKNKWKIKSSVTDLLTVKPMTESSHLVYSNLLEIYPN